MSDLNKAKFLAIIPDMKTGIMAGGDGMTIKLEIPKSEDAESVKLFGMKGVVLEVVVKTGQLKKIGGRLKDG